PTVRGRWHPRLKCMQEFVPGTVYLRETTILGRRTRMAQNGNGKGAAVNLDEKVVIVSSDCHIGPRVKEDLAQYCPKKYKEDFDDFVKWMDSKESGIGGIDALELTTGHYDVHARLRDLDKDGTAAETIFHGSQ